MGKIKRMNIKEFRAQGYLQEVNRKFFHPLGLAIEVFVDEDSGEETIGGVWDYREDPTGIVYADGVIDAEKARRVETLRIRKIKDRMRLGCDKDGIQPVRS